MKLRIKLFALMAVLAGALTAIAADLNRYEVNVGEFSELKVIDGINIDYRCSNDSAGFVAFTCPSTRVSDIMLTTSGNKLTVQLSADVTDRTSLPTLTVYSRYLVKVLNSSDSTVRIINPCPVPQFEAVLEGNGRVSVHSIKANQVSASIRTGNGTIMLSGKCTDLKLSSVGTGTIEADELEAEKVKVRPIGTGSVGVWATKSLSVFGTGSTTVYYKGNPPEISNTTLGIKLYQLP